MKKHLMAWAGLVAFFCVSPADAQEVSRNRAMVAGNHAAKSVEHLQGLYLTALELRDKLFQYPNDPVVQVLTSPTGGLQYSLQRLNAELAEVQRALRTAQVLSGQGKYAEAVEWFQYTSYLAKTFAEDGKPLISYLRKTLHEVIVRSKGTP